MPAQTLRHQANDPRDPVVHELSPLRFEGATISIKLIFRQADDGMWRGKLHFTEAEANLDRETAEIFCGTSQQDLWQSLSDLREHHFRDLYRSLL